MGECRSPVRGLKYKQAIRNMIKYTAARHDRTSKIGQNLKRYKDGRSVDPVLKNRFIGQRKGSKTGILSLDI